MHHKCCNIQHWYSVFALSLIVIFIFIGTNGQLRRLLMPKHTANDVVLPMV
jgi:hypothetical protein